MSATNNLTHGSVPRNAALFRAAERLGLAEQRGLGVDRMYRETLQAGHPTPAIFEELSRTVVIFTRGERDRRLIGFIAGLPTEERESVETLLVIRNLLDRPTLTADTLADAIQQTPAEALAALQRLAALLEPRLIEPTRETRTFRSPTYRLTAAPLRALGPSVPYNRARSTRSTGRSCCTCASKDTLERVSDWLKYAEAKNVVLIGVASAGAWATIRTLNGIGAPLAEAYLYLLLSGLVLASVAGLTSLLPIVRYHPVVIGKRPEQRANLMFFGHLAPDSCFNSVQRVSKAQEWRSRVVLQGSNAG